MCVVSILGETNFCSKDIYNFIAARGVNDRALNQVGLT